ncbi:MAG: SGNH hydrolase domain-containing protein, partial [Opitutales bacterium]|nr:SGNH hydrolase domain-containing protein [Opitutales bacterium]
PREISMLGLEPRSQKFSESVRDLARTNYDSDLTSEGYYFGGLTNKFNDLLLLGDSHARMLIPSLSEQLKSKNLKGFHPYNKTSKSNFLAVNPGTEESFIDAWQKQIKQFSKNSKVILISFRHTRSRDNYFYDPINSQPSKIYYDNLRRRILHLSALVPKLIIVAPFPESPYWGPNLGRSFFQNENQFDTSTSRYLEIHQQVLSFFRKISEENSSIYIFYPHYFLTNKNSHLSHFGNDNVTNEIIPYYYDDDHLNSDGSKGIVNKIVSSIP